MPTMQQEGKTFRRMCKTYLKEDTINMIAKALTEYAFRSGPIEDIHSDDYGGSRITQEEMKQLNKYMVNKLATVLTALSRGKIDEVLNGLALSYRYATHWDKADILEKDIDAWKTLIDMRSVQ